jgi:MFS family permease
MIITLLIALFFNLSLGLIFIVVPLYAKHLGMPGVAIGSLVAIPVLLQITISLAGGALTDRYGEKRLLALAMLMMTLSGVIFYFADTYYALLAGQLVQVAARALFWPVTQALVSHFPVATNIMMGRLNAVNNSGQVGGAMVAGLVIAMLGFKAGLLLFTCLSFIAFLLACILKVARHEAAPSGGIAFKGIVSLFRSPIILFSMLCAFIAAQPYALGQSFYPVYLESIGIGPSIIGMMLAARPIGGVLVGLFLARFLNPQQRHWVPIVFSSAVGLHIFLMPAFENIVILALIFLVIGISSEVVAITFLTMAAQSSQARNRASALAVAGFGFSSAFLVTPTVFGFIVDFFGFAYAFYLWGTVVMLLGVAGLALRRRLRVGSGLIPSSAP